MSRTVSGHRSSMRPRGLDVAERLLAALRCRLHPPLFRPRTRTSSSTRQWKFDSLNVGRWPRMFLLAHLRESRRPRLLPLQSAGYEASSIGSYRALVTSNGGERRARRDRASDDRSFREPRLSVRVPDDCAFCIARAVQRGSFEIAPGSKTHFLGPLIHGPGEGLGGPALALGD